MEFRGLTHPSLLRRRTGPSALDVRIQLSLKLPSMLLLCGHWSACDCLKLLARDWPQAHAPLHLECVLLPGANTVPFQHMLVYLVQSGPVSGLCDTPLSTPLLFTEHPDFVQHLDGVVTCCSTLKKTLRCGTCAPTRSLVQTLSAAFSWSGSQTSYRLDAVSVQKTESANTCTLK